MQHMIKNVRISRIFNSSGAAKKSTAIYGKPVNMEGFEGCLFLAIGTSKQMGASTDTPYMRIQGASATGGTFYSLNGTTVGTSVGAWTSNNLDYKILAVDIYKPLSTNKVLRPVLIGSCTGDFGGMLAIQYGAKKSGSSDVWKSSTRGGSTLWKSTQISQTLAVGATGTANTTK